MTSDEKIGEPLTLIQNQGQENWIRFSDSDNGDGQLLRLIQEQEDRYSLRFGQIDARFAQVDDRFTQLEVRLEAKIDKVFDSLSQDIQIFAEDLHGVKRRVAHLEKKFVS